MPNSYYITSFDYIREGFNLSFPWITSSLRYQRFYEGEFAELFGVRIDSDRNTFNLHNDGATIENGLKQLANHGVISLNFFKVFSDFYRDALWGTPPQIVGGDPEFDTQWQQNRRGVMAAIRDALESWSITGRGVILVEEDGNIRSVDATCYLPVVAPYNPTIVTGHVLVYKYHEDVGNLPSMFNPNAIANKVRIIKYSASEDVNEYEEFELAGNTIGRSLESGRSTTKNIITFGEGDSFYKDIRDAVRTVMIRVSHGDLVLNQHAFPQYQIPTTVIDTNILGQKLVNAYGNPTVSIPDDSTRDVKAITWDAHLMDSMNLINYLMGIVSMIGGVPQSNFTVSSTEASSSTASSRLMLKTISIISQMREQLEYTLRDIMFSLGIANVESATINFKQNPFATFFEETNTAISLWQAGVTQRNEVRESTGYSTIEGEEGKQFSEPRPSVALARMQDDVRDNKESERGD